MLPLLVVLLAILTLEASETSQAVDKGRIIGLFDNETLSNIFTSAMEQNISTYK